MSVSGRKSANLCVSFSCKPVIKLIGAISLISIMVISSKGFAQQNGELALVGNRVASFIDTIDNPSRASDLVAASLSDYSVSINATTQAWSGSGLRNGKYQGYIDHYSLNEPKQNYLYSEPYATVPLHIASTYSKAVNLTRLDKIYRQRLGIENRFANTDQLRSERSVSWARAQDFFGNIQQLAEQRVDYIIADIHMLNEFNKMLAAQDEELLYISSTPIYKVGVSLAVNTNVPNAAKIIADMNDGIKTLRETGVYDSLYNPVSDAPTILDEAIYVDILRRW